MWDNLRIKAVGLGLMAGIIPAAALACLLQLAYGGVKSDLAAEPDRLAADECRGAAQNVYFLVRSQDEFSRVKVKSDLKVAWNVFDNAGDVHFSDQKIKWNARNQYTLSAKEIELPKMFVGDHWLGQNSNFDLPSPVVDTVTGLVGGTCTIFQRMNKRGDMLRVCTNVPTEEPDDSTARRRAIGTYIPAMNPDGKPNPVIETLMNGGTYLGRAFVVDRWYLTAYEPIRNERNAIVGALYVGLELHNIRSVLTGIEDVAVGSTGRVLILGSDGNERGTVLIPRGAENGSGPDEFRDLEHHNYVESMIEAAVRLHGGHVAFVDYRIAGPDGQAQHMKAAVTYFAPWKWVIVATTNVADYQTSFIKVAESFHWFMFWAMVVVAAMVFLAVALSVWFTRPIFALLHQATDIANHVATGDLDSAETMVREMNNVNGSKSTIEFTRNGHRWKCDNEMDKLYRELVAVVHGVSGMVSRLRHSCSELRSTTGALEASADARDSGAGDFITEADDLTMSVRGLAAGGRRISESLSDAGRSATETAGVADVGFHDIQILQQAMTGLESAIETITAKLDLINSMVAEADLVVATIAKVSEKTNLLSVNAAIEAEKAGEFGAGFLVVAREIRRLADQTASATSSIDRLAKRLHSAVSAGVMGLDKFVREVNRGKEGAEKITKDYSDTIESLQEAAERFGAAQAEVNQQSKQTDQLIQSLERLSERGRCAMLTMREFSGAAEGVQTAVIALDKELSQYISEE